MTHKNNWSRIAIGCMACFIASALWFVMNDPDKQQVKVASGNPERFYYTTLNEISGEEAKCVAWEVPGTIGTAYICISKVVVDGKEYPVFGFQTGEFSGVSGNPETDSPEGDSTEREQCAVLLRNESMPVGKFFEAFGKAKGCQGDWITNNLAATQIVELLQSEKLIVKQPKQMNRTFVFDLSVPSAKGFADVVSEFLAVR